MTDGADAQDADTDTESEAVDGADEETLHAPEWTEDAWGYPCEKTYAHHVSHEYWVLIAPVGDKWACACITYDEDTGDTGVVHVVQGQYKSEDETEWWEVEQKLRKFKNDAVEDVGDLSKSKLKNELLDARSELQGGVAEEVWDLGDDASGFEGIEFGDPLGAEDLFERTAYVHEYRFGDKTEFRVGLERDEGGETREIKIEWEEWQKEDGQSTKPAVQHKAEAVLPNDEDVELPWPKWQKLKKAWKRVAEMKHEEAETEWEYQADSVVTKLFMQARVVSDRAAVMNSSSEPVAWYDSDHSGAVAPSDAKRKPIGDDEAVVWVRSEDVARVCRDLGIEMSGSEKRSKMTKLSEAFQRKGLTTRGVWKTKVSGHNVRLYPFKLSEIGVDEEDVVGGGDDEEITPSDAAVSSSDDDGDDDDDGDAGDSGSSTDDDDGGSGGESGDDDGDSEDDADNDADDGEDGEEVADGEDVESEPSATESDDGEDAVDGDSDDDDAPETDSDDDDGGDNDVPTRSLPGSDDADPDDVDDDVLRTVAQVVEQEATGDGAVDVTAVQAACARQHSTNPADVTEAVDALEDAGVLESVSDDETVPGEESVDSVINGGEQA